MTVLPELPEDWYWNRIEGILHQGVTDGVAREYVVSASRTRGLPKYISHTLYVSLQHDSAEDIRELFAVAYEAVAAGTQSEFPNQDKLDALAEVIDGFEDARQEANKPAWVKYFEEDNVL